MLRIVTDRAADMLLNWVDDYEINIIPININFFDKTYIQGVDVNNEDFPQIIELNQTIRKTTKPTPKQFIDFYHQIAEFGDTILSMHVTSKLSGTLESALLAARVLGDNINNLPFDSASGSGVLGFMCKESRLIGSAGASIYSIFAWMNYTRKNINITFALNTLEDARLSRRVRRLQAALASLLNGKAIVVLRDGSIEMAEKVRTR